MSDETRTRWLIATGAGETSAAWDPAVDSSRPERQLGRNANQLRGAPTAEGKTVFVCAHGAGGHMGDRALLGLSAIFRPRGIDVVRFNFLYRARGSGRPDPMPTLLSCFAAVVARVREEIRPDLLIIGGRSMGGRAASVLAASTDAGDGLLLLAYPLHPPGQPEKLRTAHLSSIKVPVLCFSGTHDAFCRRDLMEVALTQVGSHWTMHWLEGADHGFHVLKRSGTTDEAILAEVGDVTQSWVTALSKTSHQGTKVTKNS